jgi:iron complex transport system ATP-binding protein
MNALLDARDVTFNYPGGPEVIERASLQVARGAIVGLLGPNGSGKTTLLRLLSGTLTPKAGRITFDGTALGALSRRELARRVALVPQETHSAFEFAAIEIVLMGRYPHLGAFQFEGPEDVAIARAAMAATGTEAFEQRPFPSLSGGEKQRVVIAGALAQATDVLLLDEPTASLDLGYQLEIASLLTRLNRERGTTMVVSTHDLNLAAAVCTELALIRGGRILAQGSVASVLTPANVRELYGIEAEVVVHAAAGHLTVIPIARRK